jgi:carbon-monoxide dehydrogenase large subunit
VHGIKGMGEGGLLATPGAVMNAVLDALAPFEPHVRRFPLTPDRIFDVIGQGREGARGRA